VSKIRNLQESPHPACGHLLPEGEGKESNDFVSPKQSNLQMKSMTQKPSPVLGEGGPAVLVGEGDSTNYMEAMKSLF